MAIIGDVFGLTSIYERQVENIANDNFESWPESATYGYFAGGSNPPSSPSYVATVDRIDFLNETASLPGNDLPSGRKSFGEVSSSSYGYFGGGYDGSNHINTINRLDFSNETFSAPGNNLSQVRQGLGGTQSSSYGYFAGGSDPAVSPSYVATVDRIDFSSETMSTPGNNLPSGRKDIGTSQSSSYGYFGGGYDGSNHINTINRLDFSSETFSAPGNNLSQVRQGLAATQSSSYGYFGGGSDPAVSPSYVATVDRIDFLNETASLPGNNLPSGRKDIGTVSSSSYGYFGGGYDGSNHINTINRLDFSNETFSAPGNNLSQVRQGLGGVSGGASYRIKGSRTYGYFGGGDTAPGAPGSVATVDRIDFSNETTSAPGNDLTQARRASAATESSFYGYFGGGFAPPNVDTIDRIDFSNETVSAPGKDLPVANQGLAAVSSSSYGYFGGGASPSSTAVVNRFDFSSETFSAPGNDLTQARNNLAAVSNSSYGYFGGGGYPEKSTVDRIDFSNETVSAPGNNLPSGRHGLGAVSGNSYGYFAGGENYVSPSTSYRADVFRMDFSNETFAGIVAANNLPVKKFGTAGTSSNSYGYFGGGNGLPSPSYLATVDRIDFTTHICSATGNNLPQARSSLAAVSN
jgi:hypothetical protein